MKRVFALMLVVIMLFGTVIQAAELGDIYVQTKSSYGEIVQRLYSGGANDEQIISFFDDVQYELILSVNHLDDENFDTAMQNAIIAALKYSKNLPVYNALLSQFSEEAVYFFKNGEIPESLKPLYMEMKESILSNESLMFKITCLFLDQNDFAWAMPAIEEMVKSGIIKGYPDKTFKGNESITRAEFTKMVVMAFSGNDTEATSDFYDVKVEDWYYSYVSTAKKLGIINGYDGNVFKPNEKITRQDMAVIIKNAKFKDANASAIKFTDVAEISDYALGAVSSLSGKGVINGMGDGSFAPKSFATRAQAAQMIYNAMSTQ